MKDVSESIDEVDGALTLDGLRIIHEHLTDHQGECL
jgi:hypothetical protein